MTATALKVDAFGYVEGASTISQVDLINTANQVSFACGKSAALLRTLHFRLANDDRGQVNIDDAETLIELALSALPDPNGEAFDAFDRYYIDVQQTLKALLIKQQTLTTLFDAMALAARPEATLEEINEAATIIYRNTGTQADDTRHWDAFCALIKTRGLLLEWVNLGVLPPQPEVHTKASLKQANKVERKIGALTRAVEKQTYQNAQQHRNRP